MKLTDEQAVKSCTEWSWLNSVNDPGLLHCMIDSGTTIFWEPLSRLLSRIFSETENCDAILEERAGEK